MGGTGRWPVAFGGPPKAFLAERALAPASPRTQAGLRWRTEMCSAGRRAQPASGLFHPLRGMAAANPLAMRILALQLKRIGDLVLTTPALQALRQMLPDAQIALGVSEGTSGLLPAIRGIDSAIVFGSGRGFTPWQQVLTGSWDVCLDFTGTDRSALATALSRARNRATFEWVQKSWIRALAYRCFVGSRVRDWHTADQYLHLLRAFGVQFDNLELPLMGRPIQAGTLAAQPLPNGQPVLELPEAIRAETTTLLRAVGVKEPFVLVHPGTARLDKYWHPDRWAAVIQHLREKHGCVCVLSGGLDTFEQAHLDVIQASVPGGCPNLAGNLTLLNLATLSATARLVVSCDTSVVHLASAFQTPQVVLYGPINPFHWRPRHGRAVVISATQPDAPMTEFIHRMKGASMDLISTEAVIRATDIALISS
jgi:ADP-heptose:LPS heptosyltransferase